MDNGKRPHRGSTNLDELSLILDQLTGEYSATHDPGRKRLYAIGISKLSEVVVSINSRMPPSELIRGRCLNGR